MAAPDLGRFFYVAVIVAVFSVSACASEEDTPKAVTADGEASLAEQLRRTATAEDWKATTTNRGDVYLAPPQAPEEATLEVTSPAPQDEAVASGPDESALAGQLPEQPEAAGSVTSPAEIGTVDDVPLPQSPPTESLAEQVSEQLGRQGWQVSGARDGSRIYVPSERRTESAQTVDHVAAAGPTVAEDLQRQLMAQGWTVRRAADGSLIYRQPTVAPPVQVPTLADGLRRQLEHQGWIAIRAADGSLIYRQPTVAPPVPVPTLADDLRWQLEHQGWTATRAADGSLIYRQPTVAPPVPVPTLADDLRRQLEHQGWTATRAADGSVFYRKPNVELPASSPTLADDLRRQLEQQGWRVTVDEDGGHIYRMPGTAAASGPSGRDGRSSTERDRFSAGFRNTLESQGWTVSPSPDGGVFLLPPEPDAAPGLPEDAGGPSSITMPDSGPLAGTGHGGNEATATVGRPQALRSTAPGLSPGQQARIGSTGTTKGVGAERTAPETAEPVPAMRNRGTGSGVRTNASYANRGRAGWYTAPNVGGPPPGWRAPAYPQHPSVQAYGPAPGWMPPPWGAPPPGAYGYRR